MAKVTYMLSCSVLEEGSDFKPCLRFPSRINKLFKYDYPAPKKCYINAGTKTNRNLLFIPHIKTISTFSLQGFTLNLNTETILCKVSRFGQHCILSHIFYFLIEDFNA